MEEKQHSYPYSQLSEEQKNLADAIISFLNGQNTASIEQILLALKQEIKFFSEIKT